MNVELITIGDELLLGFTVDTNAAWLSRELAALGIAVTRRTTCGDRIEDIVDAVANALDKLKQAAKKNENTMPATIEAVRAYATLGEICSALRDVYGIYEEPAF